MRDLGRGLAVLYHGHGAAPHLPDGIQPTFTPKFASMCFEKTGVHPFDPYRIDRSHLRKTLKIPTQSEHDSALIRDGPASIATNKRVQALPEGSLERVNTKQQITIDQQAALINAQAEELRWYRDQIRAASKNGPAPGSARASSASASAPAARL